MKKQFLQIKAIKAEHDTVDFMASTNDVDREQEVIDPKGWDLKNFKNNPVILWAHSATDLPIGKATKVEVREDGSPVETYTIVGIAEANPKDGLISNESPLGRALLQGKIGDKIKVKAPAGDLNFKIVKIK